jgi:hypothetical protein
MLCHRRHCYLIIWSWLPAQQLPGWLLLLSEAHLNYLCIATMDTAQKNKTPKKDFFVGGIDL